LTPRGPSVYCGCLLRKARARSADIVFQQVRRRCSPRRGPEPDFNRGCHEA